MMGESIAVAAVFIWLGMVLAISFVEAPLKFRAPGVTLQIGLGIGRLVFRALNACEVVLAAAVLVGAVLHRPSTATMVALVLAVAALVIQLAAVRPALTRRSDRVLAGSPDAGESRSRVHYAYVALEIVKVVALVAAGILLLGG
ncbi:hypothetical protein [Mycobacterium sp. ACS4331]|uniref:hypothetical protein n=1 Tax=Mycobacterium sp. ACS4331 TaxID=1834121 RepID=UPI0007FCE774|nr:hypothetical protein [Mycobacterium sp. ACS4331]OBF21541.1 hypothetical protein A5727_08660 [Mycobacterium sp. ACS4331]